MTMCVHCDAEVEETSKFCPNCGTQLETGQVTERLKVVTVMFCDIIDSTAIHQRLDPSRVLRFNENFRTRVHGIVTRHGGEPGTFMGDGLMAVFGVPTLNDDDALRAVRAAVEVRDSLSDITGDDQPRVQMRIGIHTGQALVTNVGPLEQRVTGLMVVVARRLEQAAGTDGILVSDRTHGLVRSSVRADRLRALRLKGIATPVDAWRLHDVTEQRLPNDGPLLGRDRDLTLLLHLFERAMATSRLHLAAVYGPAGMGKSRLVREFERAIRTRAQVLRGTCPSYGESVTFWPLMQIVRQAAGIEATDTPETVRERLTRLLVGEPRAEQMIDRLAQLLGSEGSTALLENLHWAVLQLLEHLARRQRLVVIFDDLQFARPALLDLVRALAEKSVEAPVLLVCMARAGELRQVKPDWPGFLPNGFTFSLVPLPDEDGEALARHLLDDQPIDADTWAYIAKPAAGNPLFVEEFIDMLRQQERLQLVDGTWVATDLAGLEVPDNIQALLAARLGRLGPSERAVLECAAVVGEQFHTADIIALSDKPNDEVLALLAKLQVEELIRPDAGTAVPLPNDSGDTFRFRHILLRDSAYDSMTSDQRGDLHERYGSWLEANAGDRITQFDELIGHHLYAAHRYQTSVARDRRQTAELARRAGERLLATGQRAYDHRDLTAADTLLSRAVELLPDGHPDGLAAALSLADVLCETSVTRAISAYGEAVALAEGRGDKLAAAHARVGLLEAALFSAPDRTYNEGHAEIEAAVALFGAQGDDLGLAKAWRMRAYLLFAEGRNVEAHDAAKRALEHADRAGDRLMRARVLDLDLPILLWGPTPLEQIITEAEQIRTWAREYAVRWLEATALGVAARAEAMRRNFDRARRLNNDASAIRVMTGERLTAAADSLSRGLVELLASRLTEAEQELHKGSVELERMGSTGQRANVAALLSRVLYYQGRFDEAYEMTQRCQDLVPEGQIDTRIRWRCVRALVLARRGEVEEASRLAEEAAWMAKETQQTDARAEALLDLAMVYRGSGSLEAALSHARNANALYLEKGNKVGAQRAKDLELELSAQTGTRHTS